MDNKNNKKEYSQENCNLEIVKKEERTLETKKDSHDVRKSGNIFIGTLNVITRPIKDRHEKHYKESNFHLVADIILALIVLLLIGGLIYIYYFKQDINVELKSSYLSENIISGNLETFELEYINREKKDISDCTISVRYPENFVLLSVSPSNVYDENTNTFNLGKMNNGANGKIKITGQVLGEVGSQQFFSFTYNYKANGKDKNLINSLIYNIEESALIVKLDVPEKTYKGMEFDGKISIENRSSLEISNINLLIQDKEWELLNDNKHAFAIDKINPGEIIDLSFSAINKNKEGDRKFVLETYVELKNTKFKQGSEERNIIIKVPSFKVSLSSKDKVIKNNSSTHYKLDFINNEEEVISDVVINLRSGNNNFKINNIKTNNDLLSVKNKSLIINKNLVSGEKNSINFSTLFNQVNLAINQEMNIVAVVNYKLNNQNINYELVSNKLKVLSDLKLSAKGYYYSPQGDQLGSGPLPPTVGYPTNYWIFLELDNFGNNLENFELSAFVPEGIIWMDNKSVLDGELLFGRVGGKVIWEINDINSKGSSKRIMFELGVVPTEDDFGMIIRLLGDIKYKAFDTFCNQEISGTLAEISTDIPYDKLATDSKKVKNLD